MLMLCSQLDIILCSPEHLQKNDIDKMKTAIRDLQNENIKLGTRLKASESKTNVLIEQINELTNGLCHTIKQEDDKNKGFVHRILKRSK